MPSFAVKELRSLLKCGVLAHGAVRFRCDHCGKDRLVGTATPGSAWVVTADRAAVSAVAMAPFLAG
jgi:transposase-like protein